MEADILGSLTVGHKGSVRAYPSQVLLETRLRAPSYAAAVVGPPQKGGNVFPGLRDEILIGEGGLGRVYRATNESTGGVVAIKQLSELKESSPAWHRVRREPDARLRLKGHPNVPYPNSSWPC